MSDAKSVDRVVRIVTNQKIKEGVPTPPEGFPVREWSIEVYLLNEQGEEVPATVFDKVVYTLHPTFAKPVRTLKEPPFRIAEQGWGEFELMLNLHFVDRAGERKIVHDLNFLQERYVADHTIHCPVNKSEKLRRLLQETGPVPNGDGLGEKRKGGAAAASGADKKRSKVSMGTAIKGSVDLEKLAEGLTKLSEDDLLGVVQMVTDNRTSDMNIKNDVEEGEFTMDLYTLPESLLKSLWEYVKKRTE